MRGGGFRIGSQARRVSTRDARRVRRAAYTGVRSEGGRQPDLFCVDCGRCGGRGRVVWAVTVRGAGQRGRVHWQVCERCFGSGNLGERLEG